MTSIEALVNRHLMRLEMKQQSAAPKTKLETGPPPPLRVITISRQTGSGGRAIARHLAETLGLEFVDRQILDYITQNTGARAKLIDSLDERTRSGIDLWVEGILRGRYIDRPEYTHWLVKSVTAMAEHGDAVILGRAGNVILGARGGLHVRVIAPRELRVANLVNYKGMTLAGAEEHATLSDEERREFYRKHFNAEIENPADYHLVVNTGRVSLESAREMILAAWKRQM
jgi:cytidylate kinase